MNTKVVILAGGRGTRLAELTGDMPKPMLMVGDKPIIQHIIDNFVRGGFTNFLIPIGYLGGKIRSYFRQNYSFIEEHESGLDVENDKCVIEIVETGIDTMTGGRLLRLKSRLPEPFMLTYGDGLSNVNPKHVKELGEELNKNIVTVIHPAPRFGAVTVSPNAEILSFSEKQVNAKEWVNGGFMYLKPEIFGYIKDDTSNLEKDCLPKVVWDSGLYAFQYEGVWTCVDTIRDLELANEMMKEGIFKWMI
jgi:glucose-1-phosphate cytidylyltransferase